MSILVSSPSRCDTQRGRSRCVGSAGQKHQSELADLHLVAVGQYRRVHGFTVDVSAVEAARVNNRECAPYAAERGVGGADGDVVEEDIAIGVTTGRRGALVE